MRHFCTCIFDAAPMARRALPLPCNAEVDISGQCHGQRVTTKHLEFEFEYFEFKPLRYVKQQQSLKNAILISIMLFCTVLQIYCYFVIFINTNITYIFTCQLRVEVHWGSLGILYSYDSVSLDQYWSKDSFTHSCGTHVVRQTVL